MQSALNQAFSEPLLAAMPQLSEKPHQGVPSSNPALYLGHEVSKSTTALGLRAALHLERVRSRYTGKEHDSESGNDYFGARYYASAVGRWLSPDWSAKEEPVPYAKLDDPQSLNLYDYLRNNPIGGSDPDGHTPFGMAAQYAESNANDLNFIGENNLQHEAIQGITDGSAVMVQETTGEGTVDKFKSTADAAKDGYNTGKELVGEFKEAVEWNNIMRGAFDTSQKPASSGLEAENLYYYSVFQYAQQQAIYHGLNAGLTLLEIQNGILKAPPALFFRIMNRMLSSGIRAQALVNIDTTRSKMNQAHDDYVRELFAAYGRR